MALARVITKHPHAVQRELLIHRFRWGDFGLCNGTQLQLWEFVSFVLGAPPTSGVGLALNEGWTPEAHLLANLGEQQAGVINLKSRYVRPGVDPSTAPAHSGQQTQYDQPDVAPHARRYDESQPQQKLTTDQVKAAVTLGGKFDRFETPADFEAKMAEARAAGHFRRASQGEDK